MGTYSTGDVAALPSGTDDLENTVVDLSPLTTAGDASFVSQSATGEIAIHQFKDTVTGQSVDITWTGQSDYDCADYPVTLQVYKFSTTTWETLATNNTTTANNNFTLQKLGQATSGYVDGSNVLTSRVYQSAAPGGIPFSDDFARSDGDLGNSWVYTSGKWTISSGAALGTPGLSGELVDNGNMETNSGWVASNTPPICEQSTEQKNGGSYSWKLGVNGEYQRVNYGGSTHPTNTNVWYRCADSVYGDGTNASTIYPITSGIVSEKSASAYGFAWPASWTSETYYQFVSSIDDTVYPRLSVCQGGSAGTWYWDDVSVKQVTTADMFATRAATITDVTIEVDITMNSATNAYGYAGIVARLDSVSTPANYVIYAVKKSWDGSATSYSVQLWYFVSGARTSSAAVDITAAYGAGKTLKLVISGTNYKIYYDDAQKGTEGGYTITDAGIDDNTIHGLWATDSGQSFDNFSLTAT